MQLASGIIYPVKGVILVKLRYKVKIYRLLELFLET